MPTKKSILLSGTENRNYWYKRSQNKWLENN